MTPPLVLLHAFPLDSRMFDRIRPAVAARVRLLTPDLRGFGSGPALGDPPPPPDLALLAADVLAELDAAGIDRAIVGGVSMGGYIALAMLRSHPDRIAGLVLAD
ncbi:MAG TPA: alpha/beta fold hydrolase, partial [Nakamurella sp.]